MTAVEQVSGVLPVPPGVPVELVRRWEQAYAAYGNSPDPIRAEDSEFAAAVRASVQASRAVASVWREIAMCPGLPWWSVAAVSSAVQAFEEQARRWERRLSDTGPRRGRRRLGVARDAG